MGLHVLIFYAGCSLLIFIYLVWAHYNSHPTSDELKRTEELYESRLRLMHELMLSRVSDD